jgi:hypothetical protein
MMRAVENGHYICGSACLTKYHGNARVVLLFADRTVIIGMACMAEFWGGFRVVTRIHGMPSCACCCTQVFDINGTKKM